MKWTKIGKALLFPPFWLLLVLLLFVPGFLIYTLASREVDSAIAIASYVLSAYTLVLWCVRIPQIIGCFRIFRRDSKLANRWREDLHLRVNASLYSSLIWNGAYAVFQLVLGLRHHSFWYGSLAGYYFVLGLMRFFLLRYTRKHKPGENREKELQPYRACGIVLLVMNVALTVMIFFMVYWNRSFYHYEITTIAMAAYTFGSLTLAIVNAVKYRKYNSPVLSAAKTVSLAAACVSMLTLEATMLTTFHDGAMSMLGRRLLLGATGAVVSFLIIAMATSMIFEGTKSIKIKGKINESGRK